MTTYPDAPRPTLPPPRCRPLQPIPLPRPTDFDGQVDGPPTPTRPRSPHARWQERYAAVTATVDVGLLVLCVIAGMLLPAGSVLALVGSPQPLVGLAAGLLVLGAFPLVRAWEARVLGNGPEEFRRLARAVGGSAVVLALTGLALQAAESVRLWVFLVLPVYGVVSLACRYALRRRLHHERRGERCMLPVLVVGSNDAVADMIRRTRRDRHFGWTVTGACTSTGTGPDGTSHIDGVPVIGDLESVSGAVRGTGYRVVAVAPGPGWGPRRLHELAWQLEGTDTELAVDPGLMEIAGPRLHITPVDGLPLVRLSQPSFTGGRRLIKNVVDRVGAAVLLLLVLPLALALAVAVRADGGPVLYRQQRVGARGRKFDMVKFRSMRVGADAETDALTASDCGAGPLFKMRADPRITRIGAMLRRHSLDELPQLLNVLGGSMSLVGPRPPLPTEVETYGADARRRLLVRPGMTGLWQVSGRSDLSWEESVRLDLRYVENWSVMLDATILWKTVGAVVHGRGAY